MHNTTNARTTPTAQLPNRTLTRRVVWWCRWSLVRLITNHAAVLYKNAVVGLSWPNNGVFAFRWHEHDTQHTA